MENRKYAFELKAKNSVEIYDYASSDEVVTLDDAHIQDFLQWYFDDDGALSVAPLLGVPQVKALVDAAQAVVQGAREDISWPGCTCGVCTRRAHLADALVPFKVPE